MEAVVGSGSKHTLAPDSTHPSWHDSPVGQNPPPAAPDPHAPPPAAPDAHAAPAPINVNPTAAPAAALASSVLSPTPAPETSLHSRSASTTIQKRQHFTQQSIYCCLRLWLEWHRSLCTGFMQVHQAARSSCHGVHPDIQEPPKGVEHMLFWTRLRTHCIS